MSEEEYEIYPVKTNTNKKGKDNSKTYHAHPALLINIGKIIPKSNNSEEDPEPSIPYKRRNPKRREVVGNTATKY